MSTYILFSNKQAIGGDLHSNSEIIIKENSKFGLKKIENGIFKRLMFSELHKKFKFETEKEKMEEKMGIKLETENSKIEVIPMPELSEEQLKMYLDTFNNEPDNLKKYEEYLSIIIYEQLTPNNFQVKKKLDGLLEEQNTYWEDPTNCMYSLNDKFRDRRFNNSDFTSNIDIINATIFKNDTSVNTHTNYLSDIIRETNWVDSNIKTSYYIPKVSTMSKNEVVELYKQIPSDYLKYTFICNLLVSRKHCHLVINNNGLLDLIQPMLTKYKVVFKYLIGYTWLTFRNEETLVRKIKDDDRFVFDINTASKLPVFPFCFEDINLNPYACVLLDKELVNLEKNCLSLDMVVDYTKYYGVCDFDEFSRRMRIFINGQNLSGILDYIDWKHCAITGSAMTACGMKYNPLIDICKASSNGPITDADLNFFFLNYYDSSDIDLICNHISIYDFIDCVEKLVENIKNLHGQPEIENIHTGTIIVSEEFIGYEMENIRKVLDEPHADIDYIKRNLGQQKIKDYLYDKYYIKWKNEIKQNNMLTKPNTYVYTEYFKPIPKEEFRIYMLDYDVDEQDYIKQDYEKYYYLKDIFPESTDTTNKLVAKISESIRYKIISKHIRTFEIFKSRDTNFFSIVSRFHMGFVRAFYNGTTVKCLPSYITSMMLQLSTDYKYFASIRDPIEIVNKYRSRGFGIILNDHEKAHLVYYNAFNPKNGQENKWINVFNVNIKSKQSVETLFGSRESSNELFKPGKYFGGLPADSFQNVHHQIWYTVQHIRNLYQDNQSIIQFFDYKTINDKGFVNPLDKYVIKMGWIKSNQTNN
jgi:hypothetical protein